VLVGLNASIVRGKLEHLLGIEMQLQRTPNITEMDSASIYTRLVPTWRQASTPT